MRVVFAGTPEVAAPRPRRDRRVAATSSSASSPGPTRRPVAAASWSPARSPSAPRSSAYPCSSPSTRATPTSRTALARARARLLPGRGVRRPAAAVGARHLPARLGQPALLGAARLARRRPGAARALGRRRGHRRDDVPDRQGARRRADLRRDDRADPARPTPPATCSRAWPRAAPGCWCATLDGIEDGSLEAREQQAEGVSFAPKILGRRRPRSTGPSPAVAIDRQVRACTPGPGAWSTYEGERIKIGPVTPDRPTSRARARRSLEVTKNAVLRRHRHARRPARRGQGVRQEADGRRRLGPRRPAGVGVRFGD